MQQAVEVQRKKNSTIVSIRNAIYDREQAR